MPLSGPLPIVAALIAAAYLAGSIPVGPIWARARGVDLRAVGSGNIGATNVARALGKRIGVAVLLLDALKGALPTALGRWLAFEGMAPVWVAAVCAFAAVLGHCFPVWLRFSGGKGVATSLGVFVVLDPLALAISIAIFALVYAARRVVSLASLAAALSFPIVLVVLDRPCALIAAAVATVVVIVARHRDNIRRLRKGEEKPL